MAKETILETLIQVPQAPLQEEAEIINFLEFESARLKKINMRVERTGGLDGQLLRLRKEQMARVDHLLDDLGITLLEKSVQLEIAEPEAA